MQRSPRPVSPKSIRPANIEFYEMLVILVDPTVTAESRYFRDEVVEGRSRKEIEEDNVRERFGSAARGFKTSRV